MMPQAYAVCELPVIPVREDDAEQSEMVTQLLFGEGFFVLETKGKWLFIESETDHYKGWVDSRIVTLMDQSEFTLLRENSVHLVSSPIAEVREVRGTHLPFYLSMGSILPGYNQKTSVFKIMDRSYSLMSGQIVKPHFVSRLHIVETAIQLIHTPYLWGGRNVMGIDCSAFTQLVYSLSGIKIPRDAKDQIATGTMIDQSEREEGDLAFFKNDEGRIVHVGIVYGDNMIIHASGSVRVDRLIPEGIYNEKSKEITHHLAQFNRYV